MMKSAALMIPVLASMVFASAISINAQTMAATCSYTDAQTAVNSAARGGTVTVPAGSCTWSSTLSLTKGITLIGAGAGNTVITSSVAAGPPNFGAVINVSPDSTAIDNDETIKISGFTFDGGNNAPQLIRGSGASGTGAKPFRNLIIGNNKLQNSGSVSGSSPGCIYITGGQTRGVIYSNTFDRCDIIFRVMGSDSTTEWSNTAFNQFSYGNSDSLFFENNTILWSSAYTSGDGNPGWIEIGQGGRAVVRYNTWNLANLSNQQEFWDNHGFQNWNGSPNSGQTGTMLVEYYGNALTNGASSVYRWMDHRGSWGLMFDNTYSGASSPNINNNQYDQGCPNFINPTPTNYNTVINNSYFFNNSVNGTDASVIEAVTPTSCTVAENQNWWQYKASCTSSSCTTGIGRGTSAPTGSCTNGTGYWVASTGTTTTSSSVIQNGKFYKCVSSSWQPYYTPYTYPHPLRAASSSSIHAPSSLTAVVQ